MQRETAVVLRAGHHHIAGAQLEHHDARPQLLAVQPVHDVHNVCGGLCLHPERLPVRIVVDTGERGRGPMVVNRREYDVGQWDRDSDMTFSELDIGYHQNVM